MCLSMRRAHAHEWQTHSVENTHACIWWVSAFSLCAFCWAWSFSTQISGTRKISSNTMRQHHGMLRLCQHHPGLCNHSQLPQRVLAWLSFQSRCSSVALHSLLEAHWKCLAGPSVATHWRPSWCRESLPAEHVEEVCCLPTEPPRGASFTPFLLTFGPTIVGGNLVRTREADTTRTSSICPKTIWQEALHKLRFDYCQHLVRIRLAVSKHRMHRNVWSISQSLLMAVKGGRAWLTSYELVTWVFWAEGKGKTVVFKQVVVLHDCQLGRFPTTPSALQLALHKISNPRNHCLSD